MKTSLAVGLILLLSSCQWLVPKGQERVYSSVVPEQGWTKEQKVDLEVFLPPKLEQMEVSLQCRYSNAVDSSHIYIDMQTIKGGYTLRSRQLSLPMYAQLPNDQLKQTQQGIVYRTLTLPLETAFDTLPAGLYTIRFTPSNRGTRIDGISNLSLKLKAGNGNSDFITSTNNQKYEQHTRSRE